MSNEYLEGIWPVVGWLIGLSIVGALAGRKISKA
jgi:hypothetical protein